MKVDRPNSILRSFPGPTCPSLQFIPCVYNDSYVQMLCLRASGESALILSTLPDQHFGNFNWSGPNQFDSFSGTPWKQGYVYLALFCVLQGRPKRSPPPRNAGHGGPAEGWTAMEEALRRNA